MSGSGYVGTARPMNGRARILAALCAAIAAGLSLLLAPGVRADELVVSERAGGASKESVEDYWTAKRIARARPLEAVRGTGGEVELRRGEPQPFNHPAPFESGPIAEPSTFPNTVNGKLYGKLRGVGPYECSATSVDAPNRGLVMTAGHCVAEPSTRELATKLAFIPSYADGERPFGTWVFRRIVVLKSWRKNSTFNFDFSAVAMSPQGGANLQDVVGGAPVAVNLPAEQTYTSVGYPANIQDGQVMWQCTGPYQGRDPRPIPNGPTPIAMGCDMGQGASGGGWFVGGALNSVTSFGYEDHPDIGYGPYFGSKTAQVYAKGGQP